MSISEADRHQLVRLLSEAITPKGAALLMEHLPPVGWADVATKRDLDALAALTKRDLDAHAQRFDAALQEQGASLRLEMSELGASLRLEMSELGASLRLEMSELGASFRLEMSELGASLRLEMAELGASFRLEMAEQGASLRSDIAVLGERFEATDARIDAGKHEVLATLRQEMLQQTRTFVLANVAGIFTAVGLAFAAAKLV